MSDSYTYEGSRVLRNKAGLEDMGALQRFERAASAIRIQELKEKPIRGDFDLQHLQAIHRHVFKDVYEWAGEVRSIDIAKGTKGNISLFAFIEEIPQKAQELSALVKESNNLRGLDKETFTQKLTEVYAKVNELHPFREGNGRATREYISQLSKEAGYQIDYSKVDKERWNEASRLSKYGDKEPMNQIFREISHAERALAFETLSARAAFQKHPELDGAYKLLHNAQKEGKDVGSIRLEIAEQLRAGRIVVGGVTKEESAKIIEVTAQAKGLMVRDADRLGGIYTGDVIAVNSHHALLQIGQTFAVRYERANLDRELSVGQSVKIVHDTERSSVYQKGQEPLQKENQAHQQERERERA